MEDQDEDCGEPCDPDLKNDCCREYWQRMVSNGLWDEEKHRWTQKGMKEILK